MAGSMADRHGAAEDTRSDIPTHGQRETGPGFLKLQSLPSDKVPPTRTYLLIFLILLKQCYALMSKHPNT